MKLLKFVNSDAPHTLADVQLRSNRLWFPGVRSGAGGTAAKAWSIDAAPSAAQGGYWLLDDNNNPICEITSVMLAVPETCATAGAHSSSAATPHGVSDAVMTGLDFRSKMGRQMERERATYGSTYKTASKSARLMMDAESVTEKKQERMKRDREAVAEAIENNDKDFVEKKKGASKRTKKQ